MFRGGLVSLIYSKTLVIVDATSNDAAAVTLMSTDIERICSGLQNIHEVWANSIEVAIAIYLLAMQVGVASVVTVGLIIGQVPCNHVSDEADKCFCKSWYLALGAAWKAHGPGPGELEPSRSEEDRSNLCCPSIYKRY